MHDKECVFRCHSMKKVSYIRLIHIYSHMHRQHEGQQRKYTRPDNSSRMKGEEIGLRVRVQNVGRQL